MSAFHDNALIGASGSQGYQISRSVRLRSSASAYFNRTLTTPTNAARWTFNRWVKRGAIGVRQSLFSAGTSGTSYAHIEFTAADVIQMLSENSALQFQLVTTQVFRDPSAWYNLHVIYDSANATSSDRIQLWVNGVRITAFSTATYPSTTPNNLFNTAVAHHIGVFGNGLTAYFDGYQTELNFIDGQALTPASFGETNAVTGVWQPKKYTGTYGTNGFYLNFSDNSSNTATTIGKDYSGNGNNWTPNNISVTAGATYDSMLDVPTQWADGGNGRGNYATLNPLVTTNAAPTTFSEANLRVDFGSSSTGWAHGSIGVSTGKWYAEFTLTSVSSTNAGVGLKSDSSLNYAGFSANSYAYENSGNKRTNDTASAYGASFTSGDVIGVAYDADAGTLTFYKNNVSQGQAFSGITGTNYFVVSDNSTSSTCVWQANFGQRPFAYTPPSGFKALNTLNLPEPTIPNGRKFFDAKLYTGNGSTQSITGMAFAPDLVWAKARSGAVSHGLFDTVRGAGKALFSNATNAEFDYGTTTSGELYQFTSDGFNLGSFGNFNANGTTYVGWQWKEGATQGFDIVTYTKNAASVVVNHSLGVAPSMIILKSRSAGAASNNWYTYHRSLAAGNIVYLNLTNAAGASANMFTSVGSSSFTIGSDYTNDGSTGVAYLFAEVAGFSRFGSYTGNGSADGPMIFTGFLPRWVLIKRTDSADSWQVYDSARDTFNTTAANLYPNLSNAEVTDNTGQNIDILSSGFKLRNANARLNASGGTYVYACFASNPFKNALAR